MKKFVCLLPLVVASASFAKEPVTDLTYNCISAYQDKTVQDKPLWEDVFIVNVTKGESLVRKYGVSPGADTFHAAVAGTVDAMYLQIFAEKSREASQAVFDGGTQKATVIMKRNDKQQLTLQCFKQ